jgi:chemotaxis protein MotB
MPISRSLLALAGAGLLLASGCANRQDRVLLAELRAENARLTQELDSAQEEMRELEKQRIALADENQELRDGTDELIKKFQELTARGGPTSNVIEINPDGSGVSINQDFAFQSGSADLTKEGVDAMTELAGLLNDADYADTFVIVEGHTDTTPVKRPATVEKFGDNWGLSAMRAAAVIRALEKAGVSSKRLRGAFRGEHDPRSQSKAENRRVEISLSL